MNTLLNYLRLWILDKPSAWKTLVLWIFIYGAFVYFYPRSEYDALGMLTGVSLEGLAYMVFVLSEECFFGFLPAALIESAWLFLLLFVLGVLGGVGYWALGVFECLVLRFAGVGKGVASLSRSARFRLCMVGVGVCVRVPLVVYSGFVTVSVRGSQFNNAVLAKLDIAEAVLCWVCLLGGLFLDAWFARKLFAVGFFRYILSALGVGMGFLLSVILVLMGWDALYGVLP